MIGESLSLSNSVCNYFVSSRIFGFFDTYGELIFNFLNAISIGNMRIVSVLKFCARWPRNAWYAKVGFASSEGSSAFNIKNDALVG